MARETVIHSPYSHRNRLLPAFNQLIALSLASKLTLVTTTNIKHMYVFRSAGSLYHGFFGKSLSANRKYPFGGASIFRCSNVHKAQQWTLAQPKVIVGLRYQNLYKETTPPKNKTSYATRPSWLVCLHRIIWRWQFTADSCRMGAALSGYLHWWIFWMMPETRYHFAGEVASGLFSKIVI